MTQDWPPVIYYHELASNNKRRLAHVRDGVHISPVPQKDVYCCRTAVASRHVERSLVELRRQREGCQAPLVSAGLNV
jgi:hypothetical protein